MDRRTTFQIDTATGHFVVTSIEILLDTCDSFGKDSASFFFQSEWDFQNNLIAFSINQADARHHLDNPASAFHQLSNDVKSHHFSVMRYERL